MKIPYITAILARLALMLNITSSTESQGDVRNIKQALNNNTVNFTTEQQNAFTQYQQLCNDFLLDSGVFDNFLYSALLEITIFQKLPNSLRNHFKHDEY